MYDPALEIGRARAEAFAAGREVGRQDAEARFGAALEDVTRLARTLAKARTLDPDALVEPFLDALMAMLRAILDEDPRLARDSLRPRALAALMRVGTAARPAALMLNPRDMAWARAQIAAQLAEDGVAVVPSEAIAPGGFRLRAGPAEIEDAIADRLDRLVPEARGLLSSALADAIAADAGANDATPPGPVPIATAERTAA